jgi:lipopolysaccharide/colanic/teichoic acid biosynthesis glycosyltransferase
MTVAAPGGPSPYLQRRIGVDRVVAALLALVLSPVVAVLGVLVRRHDGGPALIRVPRVGRGGHEFGMWKIRSMRAETFDGRATGVALTSTADDRITPIGRRLRSLHLDELPQLLNVVQGDMCLLGPRPEAPAFVDDGDPAWREVLGVPPGIAGPTQLVVGDWERRSIDADTDGTAYRDVVLPVKLAIDAWYVGHASARTDLRVLRALVRRILPGADDVAFVRGVAERVPEARRVDDADVATPAAAP